MTPYRKIQSDEAFLAARLKGIGSSDIATLAGLNRRWVNDYTLPSGEVVQLPQTPLTLWKVKTGRIVQAQAGESAQRGHDLEGPVLGIWVRGWRPDLERQFLHAYLDREDVGPFQTFTEAWHPDRTYAMAHADLIVSDPSLGPAPIIVEAKTSKMMSAKRREGSVFEGYDEDDLSMMGLPDKVFIQVQWQLYVYGLHEAHVPVLIDTSTFRTYGPVIADPKTQEKCLALAERFWWHVEKDREPTPMTWGDVESIWPDLKDKTAVVSGDVEIEARRMIERGGDLKATAKRVAEELADIKDALGILGAGNKVLTAADGDVLAKFSDRTRESLSLGLDEIEKKTKKGAELTPEEKQILAIDADLRKLGRYSVSSWREVRY